MQLKEPAIGVQIPPFLQGLVTQIFEEQLGNIPGFSALQTHVAMFDVSRQSAYIGHVFASHLLPRISISHLLPRKSGGQ